MPVEKQSSVSNASDSDDITMATPMKLYLFLYYTNKQKGFLIANFSFKSKKYIN